MAAPAYDALYLSPHLDDVTFSCGGQIHAAARRGERVLVATLCTGDPDGPPSPLAGHLHRLTGLGDDAMALRRGEDLAACAVLGAEARHLGLLDAIYRRGPAGEPLYAEVAALRRPPPDDDAPQVAAIAAALAALPPATRVLAPLAAGGHVDHRLTRRAVERVFGTRLEHYEDYPYARSRVVLWKALGLRPWRSRVAELETVDLEAKIRAAACFGSQLGMAFQDVDDMARQLTAFHRRRSDRGGGGERLWRRGFGAGPR